MWNQHQSAQGWPHRLFAPAVILVTLLGARAPGQDATLLTKEGRVEFALKGTAQWNAAQTNQSLKFGDQVRTGLRSRATVRMSDLSVLRLNELTTVELEAPETSKGKPQLNQKSGVSYFFNRERPSEIQFRTPIASGAIRGTEFNLAVDADGRTVVTLIDGEVQLKNAQGEIALRSGEQGIATAGQAPTKTAVIDAINIIQWALYYPAVIDPEEIGLSDGEKSVLTDSLAAYRAGDLLGALNLYPDNRQPASDPERIYRAAILLAVGQVEQALTVLGQAASPLAAALRETIAAVKNQPFTGTPATTGSQAIAHSYHLQSRSMLEDALNSARDAAGKSPKFGAAWIRVAELEFGFGRIDPALDALNKGLALSPRNAQGVALKGFLLSSQHYWNDAYQAFDHAIALDGALGTAWLGRGLLKIRRGETEQGRADLQVAATLEPHRSILRSYLGKSFSVARDEARAQQELALAKKLDPNDPTPWLYTALLDQQENRINEAAAALRRSQDLNNNRSVYRSRLLLDQDQAVRSANLAAIYRDAGMIDVSVREASRAVSYDYGNYSAHLFLANSYDALRDPRQINLRYETPWLSELLVADLLAPVGAANLSQNISQQEYSRLFEGNHIGVYSDTEYFSSGEWVQGGSQYGILGNTAYSLDAYYRTDPGQRPNNDIEILDLAARVKQQITAKDSLFLQVSRSDLDAGDVAQYYSQSSASPNFRFHERQEPNVIAGYHREWTPGMHTLVLISRFDDNLRFMDSSNQFRPYVQTTTVSTNLLTRSFLTPSYESQLEAYSAELQQSWQTPSHTIVAGVRYQTAAADTTSDFSIRSTFMGVHTNAFPQNVQGSDLNRISLYGYHTWTVVEPLQITAGLTYDRLHYPRNIDIQPITAEEKTDYWLSPKAGFIWTPFRDTHVRGAYTRSLGGVFFDTSVRLEPTQVAGFNQAFRSLIPESVEGLVPGTRFETVSFGLDHVFRGVTYLGIDAEWLRSRGKRLVGAITNSPVGDLDANSPSTLPQSLKFEEESLLFTLNHLVGKELAFGVRYRISKANLDRKFELPPLGLSTLPVSGSAQAYLHQVNLDAIFNHPSGFFAQWNTVWSQQSNRRYSPDIPGDDFWQHNIFLGYRFFQRRIEARVGILNLTDRDYQLNPLTLYSELPRERTFTAGLRLFF